MSMDMAPTAAPFVAMPQAPGAQASDAALVASAASAQQAAVAAQALPISAPQAAGRSDQPRDSKGAANTTRVQQNGAAGGAEAPTTAPRKPRGFLLDITV